MNRLRVLIADDHAILREGLRALLKTVAEIDVVGEAQNGEEAIALTRALRPDVVLMDVAMPGLGGLEATLQLTKECPAVRVIVLTQHQDKEYVRRFLKAGAAGCLLKQTAGTDLVSAIRAVARGGMVLDPAIARDAVAEPPRVEDDDHTPYETLTDREKQVLKLIAEGCSNKDVADRLAISVKTAMSHRDHLMEKLDLHSRTELVRFALKHGVIHLE